MTSYKNIKLDIHFAWKFCDILQDAPFNVCLNKRITNTLLVHFNLNKDRIGNLHSSIEETIEFKVNRL